MLYGTIIADPPWAYGKLARSRAEAGRSRRDSSGHDYYLSGYSSDEYKPLATEDLCNLPVGKLARDDSVLLLWTTMPFIPAALRVIEAWGFTYVTGMPWVKLAQSPKDDETLDGDPPLRKISYGVGYWFRGAAELILVGKRKKAYRTNYAGLLSQNFTHSRKPADLHALAGECFPGPYLELFGRHAHDNWTVVGDEAPDTRGEDITESLDKLLDGGNKTESWDV